MIIKIKTSKDTWAYFECDCVYQHKNEEKLLENKEVVYLTNKSEPKGVPFFLNLEKNNTHFRTIQTDSKVYLLNNEGKTIDKL